MRVAYLRVSSEEQQRKETIENQRVAVKRACESRKIRIDRLFEDDGVSGTIPLEKRPSGRALLEEVKAERVQELFVNTWDRLGRNLREFLNVLDKLERLGVKVTCISQPTSDDPAGHLMRHVFGAFAEHERERIVQRTAEGFQRKAERGGYNGGFIAFGYRKEGEAKDARLALDTNPLPGLKASATEIVRRVFRDVADGKSRQKVADYLNDLGVPPSKQNLKSIWRPNSVRVILVNPIYKGQLQWGRRSWVRDENGVKRLKTNSAEKVITAPCPAIVDEDLWQRANDALRFNQIAFTPKKTEAGYLLRGLITCGLCGLKFTGRGYAYSCDGRHCARRLYGKSRPPCAAPIVRRADLEAAVWGEIEVFLAKPGAVLWQLEQQMVAEGGEGRRVADDIKALEASLGVKATARQIALRQLTRLRITEADYDKEVESIDREAAAVEERLTELRKLSAEQDANAVALGVARSVLEELEGQTRGKLTFEKRRRVIVALVQGVTVAPVEGQKQPSIRVRYAFEPHAERYNSQWDQRNFGSYVPA